MFYKRYHNFPLSRSPEPSDYNVFTQKAIGKKKKQKQNKNKDRQKTTSERRTLKEKKALVTW